MQVLPSPVTHRELGLQSPQDKGLVYDHCRVELGPVCSISDISHIWSFIFLMLASTQLERDAFLGPLLL